MRGLARGNRDQRAFEHFHAEQCALERGEALAERAGPADAAAPRDEGTALADAGLANQHLGVEAVLGDGVAGIGGAPDDGEIGRASCRERVWQYGEYAGVPVSL